MITHHLVKTPLRTQVTADLFGLHFPMRLEPLIFNITGRLSDDYHGGYWDFHTLSNGGFYMSPQSDKPFKVICENGFEGPLSGDVLGIVACLYAYSHLSFCGQNSLDEICAEQFHRLRAFALDHVEAGEILRAID